MNSIINITACKLGERNAQQQMFNHFAPYIFTICRRYNKSNEDAHEAMQDCFIRIFNKLDSYNADRGELKPWVAKLSVNVCLNRLRSKSKIHLINELNEHHLNIPYEYENEEDSKKELLLRSIQKLPNGYRQILNLYVFEQIKHAEIAKMLNISEATSRSQLARAKTLLKKIVEKSKITHYGT